MEWYTKFYAKSTPGAKHTRRIKMKMEREKAAGSHVFF